MKLGSYGIKVAVGLVIAVTVLACQRKGSVQVSEEVPLYSILSEGTYFNRIDKSERIKLVVKYLSVSADCKDSVWMSGSISYPKKKEIGFILIENHGTINDNAQCPSENAAAGELDVSSALCIAADYLGYGQTVGQYHPYLCHKQNALSVIDLAKVALHICKERQLNIGDKSTYTAGYSQGGAVALAVHREMEQDSQLRQAFNYKACFAGAGPYDPEGFMDYIFNQEDKQMAYPILLPLAIQGMLIGEPDCFPADTKLADFFVPGLKDNIATWLLANDGNLAVRMFQSNNTVKDYIIAELFEDSSLLRKGLRKALSRQNLTEWGKAQLPVYLYHSKGDNVVPYFNTQNAYQALSTGGDSSMVQLWMSSDSTWSHTEAIPEWYLRMCQQINTELTQTK